MAQQSRGRGQRQSHHSTTRENDTNRNLSARSVSRMDAGRINRHGNNSSTDNNQAVLQEPYREMLIPAANAPALPYEQMMSGAQTVEVTYKFYKTPSPLQTQTEHINYQHCSSDQNFQSNQMTMTRPQSLLDLQIGRKSYPGRQGEKIARATSQENMSNITSSTVCRPKTRKPKKTSLSRFDDNKTVGDGPDVIAVFTYMVKNMKGIGTPEDIADKSMLFTNCGDVNGWFKRHSRIFTCFEKSSKIVKIAVYVGDATFCWNYNSKRSCNDIDCLRYHICRNLLGGNCRFGDRCRRSHDCLDQKNYAVSDQLGFTEKFSNEEIINILSVRFPRICESWIQNAICSDKCCINLHMCPSYILGHCKEGPNCRFERSKDSDHNVIIIKAYRMQNMPDQNFKKHVYVTKLQKTAEEAALAMQDRPIGVDASNGLSRFNIREADPCELKGGMSYMHSKSEVDLQGVGKNRDKAKIGMHHSKGRGQRSKEPTHSDELVLKTDLEINRTFLCEKNLTKQCRDRNCNDLHVDTSAHRLPYMWQVKIDDEWIILAEEQSVKIEEDYCAVEDVSDIHILAFRGDVYHCCMFFNDPEINAVLRQDRKGSKETDTKARRLSTKSYSTGKFVEKSFKTQWRWYWKSDSERPKLFAPDNLQHTLENKYVNKQSKYLYQRENDTVRYSLDFSSMTRLNLSTYEMRRIYRRPAVLVTADNISGLVFPASLQRPPNVTVKLPTNWMVWDLYQHFELVELDPRKDEYRKPMAKFFDSLSAHDYEIDHIYRVQNHALWRAFECHKTIMKDNAKSTGKGSDVEERALFHGTIDTDAVRDICINNFDNRMRGEFGEGAYFASTARYSNDFTIPSEQYVFLARVLVGEYTKGDRFYTRPPTKPGSAHELYDSCVDNVENPYRFIVFDTKQYYPEVLIQYHSSTDPPKSGPDKRTPNPSQNPIFTPRGSFKQTDTSDSISCRTVLPVDNKIRLESQTSCFAYDAAAQHIPSSAKGKDSAKMSRGQARKNTGSSLSTESDSVSKSNYSKGYRLPSETAGATPYDHGFADRDYSDTTNATLSKSESSQTATESANKLAYAGRNRLKIYGLEDDSRSQNKHEKFVSTMDETPPCIEEDKERRQTSTTCVAS